MRKLTQQEFDAIERDEFGYKNIPANTDCREIVSFGKYCSFGDGCSFGSRCSFGERCSFGDGCSFGSRCSFGERCSFREGCAFGSRCSFGERCVFDEVCKFNYGCSFGELCRFGECCTYKNQVFISYYQFGGFGSYKRTTRIYLLATGKVLIECGCQIGLTLDQFEQRVIAEYGEETEHGILYRAIIEVIKKIEGLK